MPKGKSRAIPASSHLSLAACVAGYVIVSRPSYIMILLQLQSRCLVIGLIGAGIVYGARPLGKRRSTDTRLMVQGSVVKQVLVSLLKLTASHWDVLLLVHGSHVGSGFGAQHRVIARRMFERQFQTRMQSFPIPSFDS